MKLTNAQKATVEQEWDDEAANILDNKKAEEIAKLQAKIAELQAD